MKEIFDVVGARIKAPLFGYLFFSFIAINWKALFYLFFAQADVGSRISYFEQHTTISSLIVWPGLFAVFVAVVYPWVSYFFLLACRVPTKLKNNAQADADHDLLLKKQQLEEIRRVQLENKERELIDQAKRDKEIEEIEDYETKQKTKLAVEELRKEWGDVKTMPSVEGMSFVEILSLPINSKSLYAYSKKKYPSLEPSEPLQGILIADLDKNKYKKITDIDNVLLEASGFLSLYQKENPDLFGYSTDYITKALGFMDADFREKHNFGYKTKVAFDKYATLKVAE